MRKVWKGNGMKRTHRHYMTMHRATLRADADLVTAMQDADEGPGCMCAPGERCYHCEGDYPSADLDLCGSEQDDEDTYRDRSQGA